MAIPEVTYEKTASPRVSRYGALVNTSRVPGREPTFSDDLRIQCDRIWAGLHAHPFLGELTRGILPLEAFRFFIEQDLLFLPAFARCMAIGAAKSSDAEELEFFTRQLDGIIRLEIPSNQRLLDQVISLGAQDRGGSRGLAPANVAYTSFLLATAAAGGPLEITAAILPCSWSYVEIARDLAGDLTEHPVYSAWVSFYLAEEEADLVLNMRQTFDDMVREEVPSDRRRRQLAEIFMMSSRLEGMFWEMAYTLDQWPDLG
jgi:thiaminase/transcriptional activator TenA